MKEKRALLFSEHPDAGDRITSHFFDYFNLSKGSVVGGYWPIGSELDLRPLLKKVMEKGFKCALPRIVNHQMKFHLWDPPIPLVTGTFQLLEPPLTSPLVIPDLLLVPLLSFDKRGHRLGYGQGHFDKFLHQHKIITIGVGFKGQEINKIPYQSHDFALDYIITEEGIIFCQND